MQEHEKWLAKAQEDLGMARLGLPVGYFSSVAYHCQQAAEKSLKGYLCFRGESIIKTHDLVKSLEQCMKYDKDFQKLYGAIRELNPYATRFRYPSEFDIPDQDDAKIAIKHAELIIKSVLKKISVVPSGQMKIQ
jgi:HEPN domain-containing protein